MREETRRSGAGLRTIWTPGGMVEGKESFLAVKLG